MHISFQYRYGLYPPQKGTGRSKKGFDSLDVHQVYLRSSLQLQVTKELQRLISIPMSLHLSQIGRFGDSKTLPLKRLFHNSGLPHICGCPMLSPHLLSKGHATCHSWEQGSGKGETWLCPSRDTRRNATEISTATGPPLPI